MYKTLAFFYTTLLFPLAVFGDCNQCGQDKVYVQLEDFIFDEEGIWFKEPFKGVRMGVEELHLDKYGYYLFRAQKEWTCPQCGYSKNVAPPRNPCVQCGFPFR